MSQSQSSTPVHKVTAPPAEGRYLTVLQVGDYPRLMRDAGGGSCIDALTEGDIAALVEGRTCLLLDLSNEGPGIAGPIWEDLHAQCAFR